MKIEDDKIFNQAWSLIESQLIVENKKYRLKEALKYGTLFLTILICGGIIYLMQIKNTPISITSTSIKELENKTTVQSKSAITPINQNNNSNQYTSTTHINNEAISKTENKKSVVAISDNVDKLSTIEIKKKNIDNSNFTKARPDNNRILNNQEAISKTFLLVKENVEMAGNTLSVNVENLNLSTDEKNEENKMLNILSSIKSAAGASILANNAEATTGNEFLKRENIDLEFIPSLTTSVVDEKECITVVYNDKKRKDRYSIVISSGIGNTSEYNSEPIELSGFYYSINPKYHVNKILNVGLRFNQQIYKSNYNYTVSNEIQDKQKLTNLMFSLGLSIPEVKGFTFEIDYARGYALENSKVRTVQVNNNQLQYIHLDKFFNSTNFNVIAQLKYSLSRRLAIGVEAIVENHGYERTIYGMNLTQKF
jgi:hypothetical protein